MNEKNTKYLLEHFPNLYQQFYWDVTETCLCWGFDVGDGWFELLRELSEKLKKVCPDCQVSQVKEKFGCFDKETEVLTDNGWKKFSDVLYTDKIATLKDGEYLEYHNPTDIINYKYTGQMYVLQSQGVDIMVTPNHNLYFARQATINGRYKPNKYTYYPFELCNYKKYFGKNKIVKKSAVWMGKKIDTYIIPGHIRNDDYIDCTGRRWKRKYVYKDLVYKIEPFLKFLGWYVAEGCCDKGGISLCLNYKDKSEIEYVSNILNELDLKHRIYYERGVIRFYNIILGKWLNKYCGHLAWNKKVPTFIKELNKNLIKLFVENLYYGDGHKSKTAWTLCTTSEKLADDVQELILKMGFTSSKKSYKKGVIKPNKHNINSKRKTYYVNILKKSNIHETNRKKISKSYFEGLVQYDDFVGCVTVKNNIIMVRRNGKSYWCGNSLRYYVDDCNEEGHKLINDAEVKSGTICEECGKKGKTRPDLGWVKTLCDKHYKEKNEEIYEKLERYRRRKEKQKKRLKI